MNVKKFFVILLCTVGVFCAVAGGVLTAKLYAGNDIVQPSDPVKNVDKPTNNRLNILILGTDGGGLRSDVMILASLDPKTKSLNMLSIPRDTRVRLNNYYEKINAALGLGREDLSIKTVKQLTGLPIHYYATVNFDGFKNVIDILGGIDFDVPQNMNYEDPYQDLYIHLKKGMQHLDGDKAEQFVRFRQYPEGDIARIRAQQAFLKALLEQKLKPSYLTKASDIYNEMKKNIKTNFTVLDLLKNLSSLQTLKMENVKMFQLPGAPKNIGGISYYIQDDQKTLELLEQSFGFDLNSKKSDKK